MKRIALILLACLSACAQTPNTANDVAEVKRLELRLWGAWHNHDLGSWDQLTGADYVWTDGKEHRGRAEVRSEFDVGKLDSYRTEPIQAFALGPDVIGLSYRADASGTFKGKRFNEHFTEFSVWAKRDGRWQNVLLHEVSTNPGGTSVIPPSKGALTQN